MMSAMLDAAYAALLARTYRHSVTAYRPLAGGGETLVWEGRPCGLSRSALTSAPSPADGAYVLPEAAYRYALYTRPEVCFRLGDRLEVADGTQVYHGRASDSFRYPGHCVTILEVLAVEETAVEETAVDAAYTAETGEPAPACVDRAPVEVAWRTGRMDVGDAAAAILAECGGKQEKEVTA